MAKVKTLIKNMYALGTGCSHVRRSDRFSEIRELVKVLPSQI